MAAIGVHHLCFGYGTTPVLKDVCFSVGPGTVCGLLGPNASGKTTLLKCINGIFSPRSGRVTAAGQTVAQMTRKQVAGLMAVVPQKTGAAFSFTSLQMVVMAKAAGLSAWQKPSKQDYAGALSALDELGKGQLAHRKFLGLSGGEQQMVLLARAMFQSPSILLLDEPTAHLDFKNQHLVLDMVRRLVKKNHLTAIVTLHDPNLAARYCDKIVMIKQGQVLCDGPARQVMDADAIEAVYDIKVTVTPQGLAPGLVIAQPCHAGALEPVRAHA